MIAPWPPRMMVRHMGLKTKKPAILMNCGF
jgi:hypothetical protein